MPRHTKVFELSIFMFQMQDLFRSTIEQQGYEQRICQTLIGPIRVRGYTKEMEESKD